MILIVAEGAIAIRPMRDDPADYALISRWLSDERVLEWYEGRDRPVSYGRALEKWGPRAAGEDHVCSCIITHEGRDIGYIQYYTVDEGAQAHPDASDCYGLDDAGDTYAIDMFVGQPELWGRGIGSAALRLLVKWLFANTGARRIVIDPHVRNARAIRAYERAGFRKVKVLPRHELHEGVWRDSWLMLHTRTPPAKP